MISGKPFFTKMRIWFILSRIVLPFLVIYIGLAGIAAVRDMRIKSDEYAAVLLSDHALTKYDYWASPSAFLGSYITWSHYFHDRNMKVRWFLRAESMDLEEVIKDRKCQSIVLVGHGNRNAWRATDRSVSNTDVQKMMQGVEKKRGEWLQLTCGEEDFSPVKLGELVMAREHVHTYGKAVTTYALVTDALFSFRHLKQGGGVFQH
jgi:hypothetical protein